MRYQAPSADADGASVTMASFDCVRAASAGALLRRRFDAAGFARVAVSGLCDALCRASDDVCSDRLRVVRVVRALVWDVGEAALSPARAGDLSDWVRSDGVRVVLLGIDVAVGGRVDVHADKVCGDGNLTRVAHSILHSPAEPSYCPAPVRRHRKPNHVQPKRPNRNRAQTESKYDQLSKYARIIHDDYTARLRT